MDEQTKLEEKYYTKFQGHSLFPLTIENIILAEICSECDGYGVVVNYNSRLFEECWECVGKGYYTTEEGLKLSLFMDFFRPETVEILLG